MWTSVMVRAASKRCNLFFMLSGMLCSKGWNLCHSQSSGHLSVKHQTHEAEGCGAALFISRYSRQHFWNAATGAYYITE